MAESILGLGSGQAASLNNDLIDKLKAAERKSTVGTIETNIEKIGTEKEAFTNIETKVFEFLASVKPFDLFVTGGITAFEQKAATTSGDSVTFDAADVKTLKKGFTSVDVSQLAQKDVYQSNIVDGTSKDAVISQGDLVIGSETFDTTNKTYQQLADEITAKTGMNASVEQVGTDSFRLVIKSEESGLDNALVISGAASQSLGFTTDGTTVNPANHILEAKNMIATVDGVEYNVSSNNITVDGLKIAANKEGISSINITEDNTQIESQMQNFITKYNELVALVDNEVLGAESEISDKSSLRALITQVKDKLFGSYGQDADKSVFNMGIQLDKSGILSLDSKKFNEAVQNDISGLKDLFVGTADKKGLGTALKETLDEMSFTGGILTTYENAMSKRETSLNTEKDKAEKLLDSKYQQLSLQFSSYGTLINQMEQSFSGLKLLINQSVASG
uniref:flagellar filament capping protein FliD n=1 Tax=Aliarcobacter sp. TaxID=2321116 RepID=UPI0040477205